MTEPIDLESMVAAYRSRDIAERGYFAWSRSQPTDLSRIWLLMHNLRGITHDFIRWLALILARTEDAVIRALLVKQLYDELGQGKPEDCHTVLYDRFYEALRRWQPDSIAGNERSAFDANAPGRKLRSRLEGYFNSPDPTVVVAAFLVGEIYAEKFDQCLAEQLAHTRELSEEDMAWLRVHTVVEAEHAGDSLHLARRLAEVGADRRLIAFVMDEVWSIFHDFEADMHQLTLNAACARPRPALGGPSPAVL
jgi:pyrroloquinoline quinone (PQQ) biosynthesis protein C